ncbi:hypothetical protein KQH40_00640 [bacterium]|nr:hypothetical protein [bacterium]
MKFKTTMILLNDQSHNFHKSNAIWKKQTKSNLVIVSNHYAAHQYLIITEDEEAVIAALMLAKSAPGYSDKPVFWINPAEKTITKHGNGQALLLSVQDTVDSNTTGLENYLRALLRV